MAEALFAGLIGFLIGRGIEPKDATAVVEALRSYVGFEPPLGLTGYALEDMVKGQKYTTAVVVRGKTYDAVALDCIRKLTTVSVLGKTNGHLEVAPTIESLKVIDEILKTQPINYLRNRSFEFDFLHWDTLGAQIDTAQFYEGVKSARLNNFMEYVGQELLYPLPVSCISGIDFRLRATSVDISVAYTVGYTDLTSSTTLLAVSAPNTWELKQPSDYDKDKTIKSIYFIGGTWIDGQKAWIDDVRLNF